MIATFSRTTPLAAVADQHMAGREAVGDEERDHLCDTVGLADPSDRDAGGEMTNSACRRSCLTSPLRPDHKQFLRHVAGGIDMIDPPPTLISKIHIPAHAFK